MNSLSETPAGSKTTKASGISLVVVTGDNVPSFKNTKRAGVSSKTGKNFSYTPKQIKQRMQRLENGIVWALCLESPVDGSVTGLECRKRLLTVLSGLCDDSLKQIPEFSFGVRYVEPGAEGVEITIEPL